MNLKKPNVVPADLAVRENTKPIPADIFRAYDIRGPVEDEHLTTGLAYQIGQGIGAEAQARGDQLFIVGRDGRLSGPELHQALCEGLLASGRNIVDIGVVPTPLVYYAIYRFNISAGVMITASHNPGNHNGFKIVLQGKTLNTAEIVGLYHRIVERRFISGNGQQSQLPCVIEDYIRYVKDRIVLSRPLKIVVDCGNGVTGLVAPTLYRALGCEVIELFCEVDGHFPNHHPDPLVPENLTALIQKVQSTQADIGLAFDGDGDRLGVVTNEGEIIWPDRQMMLFAQDILAHHPGEKVIFDVKCSRFLPQVIEQAGGKPVMWRTGHSIIKSKLFEIGAVLAGEMSGHIFFKDEWFGFDDALYVGARLLRILSQRTISAAAVFATLPNSINTPELKLPMAEDKKARFMARLLSSAQFGAEAKITDLDGVRVDFPYGWGLVRPSNTSPYLTLRFEADTLADLEKIKNLFRQQLLAVEKDLPLPF